MATEAQKMALKRYYAKNKQRTRTYLLRMYRDRDADVIAKLDAVPSKVEYIRNLVRGDLG